METDAQKIEELERQVSEYFDIIAELEEQIEKSYKQRDIIVKLAAENIRLKKLIKEAELEGITKNKNCNVPLYSHLEIMED